MSSGWYIWDRKSDKVYQAPLMDAARAFEKDDRVLRQDRLGNDTLVSTVFLGLDHSYREGSPILWETMVFSTDPGVESQYQERYASKEEALAGHMRILEMVKVQLLNQNPAGAQE